jgi:hypothetical protein
MSELQQKDFFPCRVCGHNREFDAWGGDDNLNFSYDICDCCGAEAGVEDFSVEVARRYRKKWIDSGANWFTSSAKTHNWNLEEQLEQIPQHWL